jgi:hypothetical protein
VGGEQHPHDAGQRRRQGGDDHERIGPGLKIDHDQQVDQHDRAKQAEQQPCEGAVHGLDLSEHDDLDRLGRIFRRLIDDFLHVSGDRAEIAACVVP